MIKVILSIVFMILGSSDFVLHGTGPRDELFGMQLVCQHCNFLVRVVEDSFCECVFNIGEL